MSATQQRSTFVTVVAWTFIVLSGLGTAISMAWLPTVFHSPEANQAVQETFPPFVARHFQVLFVAYSLVSVSMLGGSIGLLKRRNWARWCFIVLMVVAIVWQLVELAIQFSELSTVRAQCAELEKVGGGGAGSCLVATVVISGIFALGFSALFGWVAKKLMSAPVAAEFRR